MGEENPDNVIEMPIGPIENINGDDIDIGRMATQELIALDVECTQRFIRAYNEATIIREHLEDRLAQEGRS